MAISVNKTQNLELVKILHPAQVANDDEIDRTNNPKSVVYNPLYTFVRSTFTPVWDLN